MSIESFNPAALSKPPREDELFEDFDLRTDAGLVGAFLAGAPLKGYQYAIVYDLRPDLKPPWGPAPAPSQDIHANLAQQDWERRQRRSEKKAKRVMKLPVVVPPEEDPTAPEQAPVVPEEAQLVPARAEVVPTSDNNTDVGQDPSEKPVRDRTTAVAAWRAFKKSATRPVVEIPGSDAGVTSAEDDHDRHAQLLQWRAVSDSAVHPILANR